MTDPPAPNGSHRPVHPMPVDPPHTVPGRRATVLVRLPGFEDYQPHDNALMRRSDADDDDAAPPREAYLPCFPPYKRKRTLAGYLEVCTVLDLVHADGATYYYQRTKRRVAVKACLVPEMDELRRLQCQEDPLREMSIMQHLRRTMADDDHHDHDDTTATSAVGPPHVATCTEVLHLPDGSYHMILPYLEGGDLNDYIHTRPRSPEDARCHVPEDEAKVLFRDVMRGLQELHDRGVCHHDVSPENIMIHEGRAHIIDLGMALRVVPSHTRYGRPSRWIHPDGGYGKRPYMAPEIYRDDVPYDIEAVDVWSAGVVLWCTVSGLGSYARPENTDPVYRALTRILPKACAKWNVRLSDDLLDLLRSMLQVDSHARPTIEEVLEHPWLTGYR